MRVEEQAGRVHETKTLSEAAEAVADILAGEGVRSAVLAAMPQEVRDTLAHRIRGAGIITTEARGQDTPRIINNIDAGITLAEFAAADTGTVAEVTHDDADRLVSSLPRIHVCLLKRSNIISRLEESAPLLREVVSNGNGAVTLISGPSRTADIELKLVLGVHGPHKFHVVVYG